jgi:hypothetical protein
MRPYESAVLKIRRARDQTYQLDEEMARFFDVQNQAQGFNHYVSTDMREWWVVYRRFKPTPEMWPVQIGEIIHNLRSALDHVIFEASALDSQGSPLARIEFPIFVDKVKYEAPERDRGTGMHKIRGITSPEERALIAEFQPFKYHEPTAHFLWLLQLLSNGDKHHSLSVAGAINALTDINFRPGQAVSGTDLEYVRNGQVVLQDGIEVIRVRSRIPLPNAEVKVGSNPTSPILFDPFSPAPDFPVHDTLVGIGKLVEAFTTRMGGLRT